MKCLPFYLPPYTLILLLECFHAPFSMVSGAGGFPLIWPADTVDLFLFETLCAGQEFAGVSPEQDTTFRFYCPGSNGAPDTLKSIEVDVIPLPDIQLNGDSILCQGDEGELEVAGFFAAYQWSTGETERSIQVATSGPYSVTATAANGCEAWRTVQVRASAPDIVLEVEHPSCTDTPDGAIRILQFFGGQPPYLVSFDGGVFRQDTAFTGLEAGPYLLHWKDAGGCADSTVALLDQPDNFSLELGPDITLYPGDTVQLSAQVSAQARSWLWSPGRLFNCDTCSNPTIIHPENTTVTLLAENAEGCTAMDSQQLTFKDGYALYVPNAFAPYNGNANTTLRVFPGPGNWQLSSFEVYNRWGAPRYRSEAPVQYPDFLEWDGEVNGEIAPSGLYLWVAELTLSNGSKQMRSGSFSILR